MKSAALVAAGVAAGAGASHSHYARVAAWQKIRREGPCDPQHEVCLQKFKEELRKPATKEPRVVVDDKGVTTHWYTITMQQAQVQLHPDLPPTTMYTYDGTFPGPTIYANTDVSIAVDFPNELPTQHILPIDPTICETDPAGRAVVHLHGGHQAWQSDGNAFAWYTPGAWRGAGTNKASVRSTRDQYIKPTRVGR